MRETYQQCNHCGSTDIDKQSGAMGVHTCNTCGSSASISWKEREVSDRANVNQNYDNIIERAIKRGEIDFTAGVKIGSNPYQEHDKQHWAWMQGWVNAGLIKIEPAKDKM